MHSAVRIFTSQDGVDPSQCTVSEGFRFYHVGDNSVVIAAVDGEGGVVESTEAADVCVRLEGARLTSVSVGEVGVVEVVSRTHGTISPQLEAL